jgi:hypothetical protein
MNAHFPLSAAGTLAGEADHLSLREEPAQPPAGAGKGAAAACGPWAVAAPASAQA